MQLAWLSAGFQSLTPLSTSKLGPSGADSWVSGFVYVLGPCGSLQPTLLWGWEFLPLLPQPPWVFSISGLRFYFPVPEPWVARSVSLSSCSSRFICTQMWDCPVLQLPPCRLSSSPQLSISIPPTSLNLDECFFFISLVVGLQYSSIFWQFWLFLFLNLLLSFFWFFKEAKCVYVCLHLGWQSKNTTLSNWRQP